VYKISVLVRRETGRLVVYIYNTNTGDDIEIPVTRKLINRLEEMSYSGKYPVHFWAVTDFLCVVITLGKESG
jgi:hypothetical protein